MKEKKGNAKIIWFVLLAIVTIMLCYLFTVVYFFFISPYNIALKIGFWPFLNEKDIGKMYLDATVQINFKMMDENFENVEVSVIGVNVRKDGYILAPLSELDDCEEGVLISIFTKAGTAYNGEIVFEDENNNLAVLKCKNMDESDKAIKIPYVNIASSSELTEGKKVVMTSMNSRSRALTSSVYCGKIDFVEEEPLIVPKSVEGIVTRDFTLHSGIVSTSANSSSFAGGALFDKKGKLLGFSFGKLLNANLGEFQHLFQPVYAARNYIKDVANQNGKVYENKLVSAVCGFDTFEAEEMTQTLGVEQNRDTFYFNGTWNVITDEIKAFKKNEQKGFYLFDDFVYGENTIAKGAIVTKVKVGDRLVKIDYRNQLFDLLFTANKGDKVEFIFLQAGEESVLKFAV